MKLIYGLSGWIGPRLFVNQRGREQKVRQKIKTQRSKEREASVPDSCSESNNQSSTTLRSASLSWVSLCCVQIQCSISNFL